MKRLAVFLLAIFILLSTTAQIKTGSIKGKVLDESTSEPIPFANVSLLDSLGQAILGTTTDFDGKYTLKPVSKGMYDLQVSFVGYQSVKISGLIVKSSRITFQDIKLRAGVSLDAVEIIGYRQPLFERDQTRVAQTVTREELRNMAVRSPSNIARTAGNGTFSRDNGSRGIHSRGSRSGRNVTYVDGVKVIGSTNLPPSAIEEVSVRSHGLSAQFENYEQSEVLDAKPRKKERIIKRQKTVVFNYESYEELADNEFESPINAPLSTFSIDVDRASYANTRRYINDGYLPPRNAVRIEELINYFDYSYPQPEGEHPFSITTELAECPWNSSRQLALIGIQGLRVEREEAPKSNLVFLIDVSGSMDSPDKLDLLISGLNLLVDELRPEDRLAIVVYAGAAGLVLPSTRGDKKEKIKNTLNGLRAGGSTAGGAGIQLAYKVAQDNFIPKGNNRVILATDGDFNVGISDNASLIKMIEEKRKTGVFLSVLGMGTGNLQDGKMEQIANKGNGNYNYIDNLLEAKKVLVKEMGGTLLTIAKDVKVQAEFNPSRVKAYRLIGYVNRHLEDHHFNDDRIDAGELGSGHSVTVLYEIIPVNSEEKGISIDQLKYQKKQELDSSQLKDEVLTVKFRYKQPQGKESVLLTEILKGGAREIDQASDNLKFSASVASFGMRLRQSESVKELDFKDIIRLAKQSKGEDENGYRAEFIQLVELAELIE